MTQDSDGKHSDVTEKIIKAAFAAYNHLGWGFSEKVYENAMSIEGRELGLQIEQQKQILVYYNKVVIGEYFADLFVNQVVIAELKSVQALAPEHHAQLLNYLKATPIEVGLLLNFGPKKVECHRKIYDNHRKGRLDWPDWQINNK
jgi:GxxExxY protein